MCKNDNAGASSTSTRRAYFMRAACIFTRFEGDNPLAPINPELKTLGTVNEYSKETPSRECTARTLFLAGGCRGAA